MDISRFRSSPDIEFRDNDQLSAFITNLLGGGPAGGTGRVIGADTTNRELPMTNKVGARQSMTPRQPSGYTTDENAPGTNDIRTLADETASLDTSDQAVIDAIMGMPGQIEDRISSVHDIEASRPRQSQLPPRRPRNLR